MKQLLWVAFGVVAVLAACKKNNDKPSMAIVTTAMPASITSSSAQTGGNITSSGNSPISESGICWAFHNTPTLGDSVINSNSTSAGAFSITLNNLNANSVYYVRAFVTNGVGTAYGVTDSFTTAAGVPSLSTTAISNNQSLTAQSGGTITNNGGASITASGICWSTSANPTISGAKIVGTTASGSFADTLTNLSLGATYYVRAYATNSYGTGYGNQVTFTVSATGTVSDFDGNAYATVTIGTQTWTTSNLRAVHYQNGDPVQNAFNTAYDWGDSTTGVYTIVNGDTATVRTYGLLYNLWAVNDSRNIAPVGWHVATQGDWNTLEVFEGMSVADTGVLGTLSGTIGPLLLVAGSSGLNLQLAGRWHGTEFDNFGVSGYFWTSTPANVNLNSQLVVFGPTSPYYPALLNSYTSGVGLAVRCIKD
jgi:uncharacterized protein (TIGR02145 family)